MFLILTLEEGFGLSQKSLNFNRQRFPESSKQAGIKRRIATTTMVTIEQSNQ